MNRARILAATALLAITALPACNGLHTPTAAEQGAKKMEQIDRDTERQKYLDELERGEQRCYDLVASYVNAVRGVEVLPPAKVQLEFREPVMPADPLHDAQALELQQTLGLIGKVRARAKMDGISVDEALQRMMADAEMDARLEPQMVETMPGEVVEIDAVAPAADVAAAPVEDVAQTALNGAQVASMQEIIIAVSSRQLPEEAAIILLRSAFPMVPDADIRAMVGSAASFTPAAPAAPAAGVADVGL